MLTGIGCAEKVPLQLLKRYEALPERYKKPYKSRVFSGENGQSQRAFRVRTLQPLGYISVYFRLFLTRKIFWREKQERKLKNIRFEFLETQN